MVLLSLVLLVGLLVGPQHTAAREVEIEDVSARQLEAAIQTENMLAVYWYSKNCKTCDRVQGMLERLGAEVAEAGITLLKVNDKKLAKTHGVRNFPALSVFRSGEVLHYEGGFMDHEPIGEFLLNSFPDESDDKIAQSSVYELEQLVAQQKFVAVFFYTEGRRLEAIRRNKDLVTIAEQLNIRIAFVNDLALIAEYSLEKLPALVYYRNSIPILFQGSLEDEKEILEWLVQNRNTGEDGDQIEEVDSNTLMAMMDILDKMAVFFYDGGAEEPSDVLDILEKLDDDCRTRGVIFVKTAHSNAASLKTRVPAPPSIMLYLNEKPEYFEGNMLEPDEIRDWIQEQLEQLEPESETSSILESVLRESKQIVVVFYRKLKTQAIDTEELERELKKHDVRFLEERGKTNLEKWKVSTELRIIFFHNQLPLEYSGEYTVKEIVLWVLDIVHKKTWIQLNTQGVQLIMESSQNFGTLLVLSGTKASALDTLPKKLHASEIICIKLTEDVARSRVTSSSSHLVGYRNGVNITYSDALDNEKGVYDWALRLARPSFTKEVNPLTLLRSIDRSSRFLVSWFYDSSDLWGEAVMKRLEVMVDEDVMQKISFVKMANMQEARNYGVKTLPGLVMFIDKIPKVFSGNVDDESEVLGWILTMSGDIPLPSSQAFFPAADAAKVDKETSKVSPSAKTKAKETVKEPEKKMEREMKKTGGKENKKIVEKEDKKDEIKAAVEDKKKMTEKETQKAPKKTEEKLAIEEKEEVVAAPSKEETDSETNSKIESIKNEDNVAALFYEHLDKISTKIMNCLDKVEETFVGKNINFLSVNINEVKDLSIPSVPSLIYFKNGDPYFYEGNLLNEEAIKIWIDSEFAKNQDVIEELSSEQVHDLISNNSFVLVFVYTPDDPACEEAIKQLEQIDDDTDSVGVKFVKTEDPEFAAEFGIETFPAILYFENEQPSIYDGDAAEETELLTWLLYQMKEDTIENINRELLTKMIDEFEFLAVYFYEENEDSKKGLRHLELVDDEATEYGVRIVKINDHLIAKKYGHRSLPGIGYFRKGNYLKYDGDMFDEEEILDWMTDPNVMEISDQIEKVNKKMFEKLLSRNEFIAVFFYSETDCKQCPGVLVELETIDDEAEVAGIPIVKLEDKDLAKTVGVFSLPAVVFFRSFGAEATIYTGDIKKEESILEWMMVQKDPNNEAIEEREGSALTSSIDKSDAIAVFVYVHEGCEECAKILTELENIDDDVTRQKITMVKTTDTEFAKKVGVETFPSLIFFKDGVPNLYEKDLTVEEEVLDWLIEMKVESHIELITRPMLEDMVAEIQYLAVFFYKQNCRTCDQILSELENIDDKCDMFGIQMVKLKDPQLAKRYGIKTFPALVYFRNGNPLAFEGDLKAEQSVLEWLIDDDNRELEDEIEAVNYRMLDKLLQSSSLIAVFFYDEECVECEMILENLEGIDDEADVFGIDFVKNDDVHAARQYNIYNTPALVYFRRMSPVVYDGDLQDGPKILDWLTSQDVFETNDEIEDVNRKLLEKLLEENEFIVVYFYEDNCVECDEILTGLEKIDDETDALDITFVKVNDPRYAKKYGVSKLPSLVYFRRKFPSIYRDSLLDEEAVLEWITTNRYKQIELGVFMYAIICLALVFMTYTAFLIYGLHPKEVEKKKEE